MKIRYLKRANVVLGKVRNDDQIRFQSLRDVIDGIAADPAIDNQSKTLQDFGSGHPTPVYVDANWWVVYRTDMIDDEEILSVLSIWDAKWPPGSRL